MGRPLRTAEQFWAKVDKSAGEDACWPWTGALYKTRGGYGRTSAYGKNKKAHRVSYELANGDTGGLHVLHKCDNPRCCNPKHLFLGTNTENAADKVSKGRQLRGETSPVSRLTERDILEIRRLASSGQMQKRIAEQWHVSRAAISQIVNGKRWQHVG